MPYLCLAVIPGLLQIESAFAGGQSTGIDFSACYSLHDKLQSWECQRGVLETLGLKVAERVQECSPKKDTQGNLDYSQTNLCLINLAIQNQAPQLCFLGTQECYLRVSIALGNPKICKEGPPEIQNFCLMHYSRALNSTRACKLITDKISQRSCIGPFVFSNLWFTYYWKVVAGIFSFYMLFLIGLFRSARKRIWMSGALLGAVPLALTLTGNRELGADLIMPLAIYRFLFADIQLALVLFLPALAIPVYGITAGILAEGRTWAVIAVVLLLGAHIWSSLYLSSILLLLYAT